MKGKIVISVLIGLMLVFAVVSCDNGTQTVSSTDQKSQVWYSPSNPLPTYLITNGFGEDTDVTNPKNNWDTFFTKGVRLFKSNGKEGAAEKAVKDKDIKGDELKAIIDAIYRKGVNDSSGSIDWSKTKFQAAPAAVDSDPDVSSVGKYLPGGTADQA
jgi:hypothetical protein